MIQQDIVQSTIPPAMTISNNLFVPFSQYRIGFYSVGNFTTSSTSLITSLVVQTETTNSHGERLTLVLRIADVKAVRGSIPRSCTVNERPTRR